MPQVRSHYRRHPSGMGLVKVRGHRRRRNHRRGGALYDYIPSFSTIKSYGNPLNYLPSGTDSLNLVKTLAPKSLADKIEQAENLVDIAQKVRSTYNELRAPPDEIIPDYNPNGSRVKGPKPGASPISSLIQTAKKYRPITTIDNALNRIGLRGLVRGFLGKYELGKSLVNAADYAKTLGLGARRRSKRRKGGAARHYIPPYIFGYGVNQTRRRTSKRGGFNLGGVGGPYLPYLV